MPKADARKVAAYHTSNPRCAVYDEKAIHAWTPETWVQHFETDLRHIKLGERLHGTRSEREMEISRVYALLIGGGE